VEKSKSHDLETERSSEWLQAIRLPFDSATVPLWATEFNFRIVPKYLLTYLFNPWSRVLLEILTGLQLVKKFPIFYGTRMFITAWCE